MENAKIILMPHFKEIIISRNSENDKLRDETKK